MHDTTELLSRVPLLRELGPAELGKLAERTRTQHFRSGTDVVEGGTPGRSLYLVLDGLVQVIYPSSSGDFELARLGAGDFFGEMALLNDKPRRATVRALSPVDVLVLDKEDFRRVVADTPGLAFQLLETLSVRIRNADEQISTLSDQAVRDPLTGLLNRRAFQERLHEEVDRVRRYGTRFAVVIMEVDHFKSITDTLGHVVGDEVLTWIGRVLQEHTRAADAPFRIGGEEFAVLCAASDARMAGLAARRLISVVAEAKPPTEHGMRITLSAGYAACPEHGLSFEDVYGTADAALLQAKQEGRNQVGQPADPGQTRRG
ncbi:MAG: GGDEF domain-containing protein [Gemmatimonadetes bacterium]|nr:GGDEF domain-containing protein [Gemmatimonadota bacterium]